MVSLFSENRWKKRGISAVPVLYGISFTVIFLNQVQTYIKNTSTLRVKYMYSTCTSHRVYMYMHVTGWRSRTHLHGRVGVAGARWHRDGTRSSHEDDSSGDSRAPDPCESHSHQRNVVGHRSEHFPHRRKQQLRPLRNGRHGQSSKYNYIQYLQVHVHDIVYVPVQINMKGFRTFRKKMTKL